MPDKLADMVNLLVNRFTTKNVKPLTADQAELRERLNVPGLGPFEEINPNLPPIERAPMFRKQTPEIGLSSEQAKELDKLYQAAPQLRGRATSITSGYGPMYIKELLKMSTDPTNSPYQNTLGKQFLERPVRLNVQGFTAERETAGAPRGSIEIGPHTNESDWIGTVGHEMQHMLGLRAADKMDGLRSLSYIPEFDSASPLNSVQQLGQHKPERMQDPYHTDRIVLRAFGRKPQDQTLPIDLDQIVNQIQAKYQKK